MAAAGREPGVEVGHVVEDAPRPSGAEKRGPCSRAAIFVQGGDGEPGVLGGLSHIQAATFWQGLPPLLAMFGIKPTTPEKMRALSLTKNGVLANT